MPERTFPTPESYPLPTAALRAPLRPTQSQQTNQTFPDPNDLCEALTPLISAAIARQARQRRYTP